MRIRSLIKYLLTIICIIVCYECAKYIYNYVKHQTGIANLGTKESWPENFYDKETCKNKIIDMITLLSKRVDNITQNHIDGQHTNLPINPDLAAYSDGIADMISTVMNSTVSIATMEDDELSMKNISDVVSNHYLHGIVTKDFMYGFLNANNKKISTVQGSLGSGFIIKVENGVAYVVTNYHVISGAKNITIFLNDKTAIPAEIHGYEEMIDIAVLKFYISNAARSKTRIMPLNWGNSSNMREGNIVFAIGNPFGLGGTVTNGIISSMKRNIHDDLVLEDNFQRNIYIQSSNFIQHNASINVGSSGGCLINTSGEVIGVNRNIIPGSDEDGGNIGIALAIPSNIAKAVVDKIIRKGGEIGRGWLGIVTQFIAAKEFAAIYGNSIEQNSDKCGFFVSSVLEGSSAHKKGVRQCDIIIALNGKKITSSSDLMNFVSMANVGEVADLTILRKDGDKFNTIKISASVNDISSYEIKSETVNKHSNDDRKIGENIKSIDISDVGIHVKDLPRFVTENKNFKNNAKVIVIYTDIVNAPYSTSFEIGDGIIMADGKNIQNAYQLKMIVEQVKNEGRRYISFVVQRGKTYQIIAKTIKGFRGQVVRQRNTNNRQPASNAVQQQEHNQANSRGAANNRSRNGSTQSGGKQQNTKGNSANIANTTRDNSRNVNPGRHNAQERRSGAQNELQNNQKRNQMYGNT